MRRITDVRACMLYFKTESSMLEATVMISGLPLQQFKHFRSLNFPFLAHNALFLHVARYRFVMIFPSVTGRSASSS
jgi:hypothetical protein